MTDGQSEIYESDVDAAVRTHLQREASQGNGRPRKPVSAGEARESALRTLETAEAERRAAPSPLNHQVGGDHYHQLAVQPVEYIHANGLGFLEGAVVKYVTRHRAKHGAEDLRKAIHSLELLLELEYPAG